MKYGRPAIVLVTWRDTVIGSGWRPAEEWGKWLESDGAFHETIGFLFRKTKKSIVLCQSKQLKNDPHYDALVEIPMGTVESIVTIRLALAGKG